MFHVMFESCPLSYLLACLFYPAPVCGCEHAQFRSLHLRRRTPSPPAYLSWSQSVKMLINTTSRKSRAFRIVKVAHLSEPWTQQIIPPSRYKYKQFQNSASWDEAVPFLYCSIQFLCLFHFAMFSISIGVSIIQSSSHLDFHSSRYIEFPFIYSDHLSLLFIEQAKAFHRLAISHYRPSCISRSLPIHPPRILL
jgi:hypothetical protein